MYGQTTERRVRVEYIQYGKKKVLSDNFKIFFVIIDSTQKTVLKPMIVKDTVIIPEIVYDTKTDILFKYNNKLIHAGNAFHQDNVIKWIIRFDKKPFQDKRFRENLKHEYFSQHRAKYISSISNGYITCSVFFKNRKDLKLPSKILELCK
jgi:hypothetical protein